MKRCPECIRTYYDDTLLYCLDDGNALLEGPALTDAPATAILSEPSAPAGRETWDNEKTRVFEGDPTGEDKVTKEETLTSIAVLPFANMSADPENEYFCDGLAEDLLNALVKIEDLKVAARTSAFSFRGKNANAADIGNALKVNTILEGSVRKSGDRLRITVQLVNAANGYHLWSEQYDRTMRDILDVQDEITLAVVSALKLKLLGGTDHAALKRHTENTEAYKAYLRGRYLRHTKNDHGGAMRAFDEAVRLDPSHAPSWIGLAEGTILAAHYAIIPARKACDDARAALATAQALQGESAEALSVEGFLAYVEADWAASERAYRRSIALQQTQALGPFGLILCVQRKFDEAHILFERARDSDPLAAFPYAITAVGLVTERRLEESLPFFELAFSFEAENSLALWGHCIANISLGNFPEGIAAAETAVRVSGRAAFFVGLLGWALARAGRSDEARAILSELQNRSEESPTVVSMAWLLSETGDIDAAFELLTKAIGEPQAFVYYGGLPTFDRLRDDPRFTKLMQDVGLPA